MLLSTASGLMISMTSLINPEIFSRSNDQYALAASTLAKSKRSETRWMSLARFLSTMERYNDFMELSRELIKHNKKAYKATDYPNATGNTNKPPEVLPRTK